ncbi:cysteine desulfurase family protein [Marinitenerispora sediminis]|uniref:Cysteine desulfurase NifS n=1 Tax=Marinitenerispora sediminis TaxID=1931232 RepID=A0A368T7F0_9ACTN|nr:cysteine desulfurase family protein [Marinitenerispora sediminis]RCV51244.1 cysteine desulfurase NifS [Marinitenerispora sediminis]RCV55772.1 cysteine desulfurase NifS [Marinitenerispora sediminis]RCV57533.1 cysteine desulfurase NifS [Marinitenerispora sediminis]
MVYLDHAATTPVRPEVVADMTAEFGELGNASSLHGAGRRARRVVEEAREAVAASLGATPNEVVFTGGGTEADNLAVKGLYWARHGADPARRRILVSAVEHHAVLDPARWMADHQGAVYEELPVDAGGRVDPAALRAAIERDPADVALVSVMWANNEVGTVQPVPELAAVAREYAIPFHTDAVQAVGVLDLDFAASGVSAMTVTGHKIGGPVGAGALLLARGVDPVPVLHGGGQEREVRSGTLMTPLLRGFGTAVRLAAAERTAHAAELAGLRDELVAAVRRAVPDVRLNGHPTDRLPGIAHLSFPGCEGDALLMLLDARGIACSTGSACSAGVAQPSHVLLAMGADPETANGSLRFSLGRGSGQADVKALAEAVGPAVERARAARARRR